MAHVVVPEAEALLDKEIKVLDHGFVRLVDYMGGDQRIVDAARVSYGKGTKTVRENKMLIDYLMAHEHTSPFEHVILEIHCKMPIFVARQWVRHRTARINEISGRYSIMEDEFYVPPDDEVSFQSEDNKQGRSEKEVPAELRTRVLDILRKDQGNAYASYEDLLNDGIAKELARINLPLSLYTQWYWQMDLHNLFHFLKLRMDPHAQWEIQQYGFAIAEMTKAVAPLSYQAFEKHVLRGRQFSAEEMDAIHRMLKGEAHGLKGIVATEFEKKMDLKKTE
jgi:thymidylate synthase (FAD)